jgi:hypothetical protein
VAREVDAPSFASSTPEVLVTDHFLAEAGEGVELPAGDPTVAPLVRDFAALARALTAPSAKPVGSSTCSTASSARPPP